MLSDGYSIKNNEYRLEQMNIEFKTQLNNTRSVDPFVEFFIDAYGDNAETHYNAMKAYINEFLDTPLVELMRSEEGVPLIGVTRRGIGARVMILDPTSKVMFDSHFADEANTYQAAMAGTINSNHDTRGDVVRAKVLNPLITLKTATMTGPSPTGQGVLRHYITTRYQTADIGSLYYTRISLISQGKVNL